MLEENRCIFNIPIEHYMRDIIEFINIRLSPHDYKDSITIHTKRKSGRKEVSSISLHIRNKKFNNFEYSDYSVRIIENIKPLTENKIYTQKYSYELNNEKENQDIVRFDYYPYQDFPHLHINANPEIWGNHLTYPESTNIDLEKLDCFKALNVFQRYVANPEKHILDTHNNRQYVDIINGGSK